MYQTECYRQKRNRLKGRLEEMVQKMLNTNVVIENLLSGSSGEKEGKR